MKKYLKNSVRILGTFVLLVSCVAVDDGRPPVPSPNSQDVLGLAGISPDLTTFVAAVEQAGLTAFFTNSDNLTVFPPTNDAFNAFLLTNNFASLSDVPNATLAQLLQNHVFTDRVLLPDLTTGYFTNAATAGPEESNLSTFINNTDNGILVNGSSRIVLGNVGASNGVLHLVNEVIALPNALTFVRADPNFSLLVEALDTASTGVDFEDVLAGVTPFTIFVPQNGAFVELLTDLGIMNLNELDTLLLASILSHHLSEGNTRSEDLSDGISLTTLEGSSISIAIPGTEMNIGTITDGAGNDTIEILAVDIQAIDGVIHSIDTVLMPSN